MFGVSALGFVGFGVYFGGLRGFVAQGSLFFL